MWSVELGQKSKLSENNWRLSRYDSRYATSSTIRPYKNLPAVDRSENRLQGQFVPELLCFWSSFRLKSWTQPSRL